MKVDPINETLINLFKNERRFLLSFTSSVQACIPLFNIFFLHPAVMILLYQRKKMRTGIRIAYCATVMGFIFADFILFGLRIHLLSPHAGFFCDGPLCRQQWLSPVTIRALLVLSLLAYLPSFALLLLRIHQMVLRWSQSRWVLSVSCQYSLMSILLAIELIFLFGSAYLAIECEKHASTEQYQFSAWVASHDGVLIIFCNFKQQKHITYELALFVVNVGFHVPALMVIAMHSICSLKQIKTHLVSSRTMFFTNQLLSLVKCKIYGALLHILAPVAFLFVTVFIDLRKLLSEDALALLRFIFTMLAVTMPFQFSLQFILKTRGHLTLILYAKRILGY